MYVHLATELDDYTLEISDTLKEIIVKEIMVKEIMKEILAKLNIPAQFGDYGGPRPWLYRQGNNEDNIQLCRLRQ